MFTQEELQQFPEYWLERFQNDLYRTVEGYMEKEGMNRTQLAEKLGVSKGHVSQILNGNYNFSIKKLISLALAIGKVPEIKLTDPKEEVISRATGFIISKKSPKKALSETS